MYKPRHIICYILRPVFRYQSCVCRGFNYFLLSFRGHYSDYILSDNLDKVFDYNGILIILQDILSHKIDSV